MQARELLLIGGLLLMGALCVAQAGELPVASPAEVGLSASKLNQAKEAVQALVDKKEVAGAVIAVARDGKVLWLVKTPGQPARPPVPWPAGYRGYRRS